MLPTPPNVIGNLYFMEESRKNFKYSFTAFFLNFVSFLKVKGRNLTKSRKHRQITIANSLDEKNADPTPLAVNLPSLIMSSYTESKQVHVKKRM